MRVTAGSNGGLLGRRLRRLRFGVNLEGIFFLPGGSSGVGIEPVHRAPEGVAFQHQLEPLVVRTINSTAQFE